MINEFCTPFCSECAGPQGRKIYQNQPDGVLPESFEVHAENHCNFLYKTSISSNRDEIIWPYNVSIQGRWSSQSRCDSDCMGWVQKRFFVKVWSLECLEFKDATYKKTSPGYLQKGGLHCLQNATQMMHKYLRSQKCGLYKMTFA